jgi:hypothetical protein
MSRRPRKEIAQSNGHARAAGGGAPRAMTSNLLIEAAGGKSGADLKRELMELCRAQGLSHGLIIRVLQTPEAGGDDSDVMMFGGAERGTLGTPVVVHRVSADDGSEELVRGLSFGEFSVRSFKDIVAAGDDPFVQNRLTTPPAGPSFGYFYSTGGAAGLSGVPSAVVAPSLLFEELELRRSTAPSQKPPLLPHPAFE